MFRFVLRIYLEATKVFYTFAVCLNKNNKKIVVTNS